MASLTIRQLDDGVKERLRSKAAESGRSMEEEARVALARHVSAPSGNVYDLIRQTLEPVLGLELDRLPRGRLRKLPEVFDE